MTSLSIKIENKSQSRVFIITSSFTTQFCVPLLPLELVLPSNRFKCLLYFWNFTWYVGTLCGILTSWIQRTNGAFHRLSGSKNRYKIFPRLKGVIEAILYTDHRTCLNHWIHVSCETLETHSYLVMISLAPWVCRSWGFQVFSFQCYNQIVVGTTLL